MRARRLQAWVSLFALAAFGIGCATGASDGGGAAGGDSSLVLDGASDSIKGETTGDTDVDSRAADSSVGDAAVDSIATESATDTAAESAADASADSAIAPDTAVSVDTAPPCDGGAACDPGVACKVAAISCATGAPRCTVTGNAADGTTCGTDQVCSAGACVACKAGVACTPTNPCRAGSTSCATGAAVCNDTGVSVANGTACGAGKVCSTGACVACASGSSCPASSACKTAAVDCTSGSAVCKDTGNVADGTGCGASKTCAAGVCGCATGLAACGGGCADLSIDAANCGACGVSCASGGCTAGACVAFGGVYEYNQATGGACGPSQCWNPDPLTSTCVCPAGLTTIAEANQVMSTECPQTGLYACGAATLPPGTDYGGAYGVKDTIAGCATDSGAPLPADGCNHPNPYTGACSCPAGTSPIVMRTIEHCHLTDSLVGGHVALCAGPVLPHPSFGGAYQIDDPVTGGAGCRVANPATGACSCPGGTSARSYRVWTDTASAGLIGSNVYVCSP